MRRQVSNVAWRLGCDPNGLRGAAFRVPALVVAGVSLALASVSRADAAELLVVSPAPPLVLGEIDTISLVIHTNDEPDLEGRPLQASVNVGRIDPPVRVGPGKYTARFYPPSTKFPQAAIIGVWHETGRDAQVEFLRLPLGARTRFPVQAKPGSEVRVFIDGERFGPVTADKKGVATVPLVVPPGIREVEVETITANEKKRTNVPIKVPPYNRVAVVATPYRIPPGGGAAMLHVFYDGPRVPEASDLRVTVAGGDAKPVGTLGQRSRYALTPSGSAAQEVKVRVSVANDDASAGEARVELGALTPRTILDRSARTSLSVRSASTKPIRFVILDSRGLGVPELEVGATASEGKLERPRDLGNGVYEVSLPAPAKMPESGRITVGLATRGGTGEPLSLTIDTPVVGGSTPTVIVEIPHAPAPAPQPIPRMGHLTLAARFGGTYNAVLGPSAGVEVGVRPNLLDRRLAFVLNASFRRMARDFPVEQARDLQSSVTRLPITAGVTYDVLVSNESRLYLGAFGGAAALKHTVESSLHEPLSYGRIVPTAEALLGFSFFGVFFEAGGAFMPIADAALKVPAFGAQASLGYRLGLF